ncbi:MAG: patatin-like phospholipase family protein, partial [Verrucomicrobiae bacterium]|nr:patatin-like phospholipase family protein [Verrucomicrobiae bacterium]NNJ87728.1 hypothetical protein [Akkermansiaceae bacterium]
SGVRPSKVSGSSAGALAAAAYASGLEGNDLKSFILDPRLQGAFHEWSAVFRAVAVLICYRGSGLLTGKKVIKHLEKMLPVGRIEDCNKAELSIGVTSLTNNGKRLVVEGDLAAYVVASCAITPIIKAQNIAGEYLIDGGFTDEAPFEHWVDDAGVDTILVHRIIPDVNQVKPKVRWSNYLSAWIDAHEMTADELMDRRVEKARSMGKKVVVHDTMVTPPKMMVSRRQALENYNAGYAQWTDLQ